MFSKKLLLTTTISGVLVLLPVSNALAGIDGPYLGAAVGYGDVHQSNVSGLTSTSSTSSGIAGRGFAGFQFNSNVALETGYTKYYNATINGYNADLSNGKVTVNSYSIDILFKGIVPLASGFAVYGKIGPAYLSEGSVLNATTTAEAPPAGEPFRDSQANHKVFPELGIGASYDINLNIVADISWLHIQHLGDNPLRNADFVGLGVTYNLG